MAPWGAGAPTFDAGPGGSERPRAGNPAATESAPPSLHHSQRLLIVDGDVARGEGYAAVLRSEGYEVVLLPDASCLMEHLHERRPDLVLVEVELAGMSGFEVCGDLKMLDEARLMPVILLSATESHRSEEAVTRGLLSGADDYLICPERLRELAARVRVQLRNRRDRELLQWTRARQASYRSAAYRDALTGLPNRRAADEALLRVLAAEQSFVVLLLDIDRFKQVNDVHGHAQGDLVLAAVGKCLARVARSEDTVARFGGEEFLVIAHGAPADAALSIGERYRKAVSALRLPAECKLRGVTVSVGAAGFGEGGDGLAPVTLIERVDAALYRAKHAGRDCVALAFEERVA